MKQITKSKIFRKVLILTFLIVSFVIVDADKNNCVSAKTCEEAFIDYVNADTNYEVARYSYFYNQPTSCATQCANDPNPMACEQTCQTNRATTLAYATIDLLGSANETCMPASPNECAQARGRVDACLLELESAVYDVNDLEETQAVFTRYEACLAANDLSSCQ